MPFRLFNREDKTSDKKPEVKQPVIVPPKPPVPTVVVFDFDGTLADTLQHILATFNQLSKDHKLNLTFSSYKDVIEIAQNVGLKNKLWLANNQEKMFEEGRDKLAKCIQEASLFPGLKEVITKLRNWGAVIGIMTNNRVSTVELFLKQHGLDNHFHFIKSSSYYADQSKELHEVLKQHGGKKENTYFVTGRTDQLALVKRVAQSVAVPWGFNKPEEFKIANAEHMIEQSDDLLGIVSKSIRKETELAMQPQIVSAVSPAVPAAPTAASTTSTPTAEAPSGRPISPSA